MHELQLWLSSYHTAFWESFLFTAVSPLTETSSSFYYVLCILTDAVYEATFCKSVLEWENASQCISIWWQEAGRGPRGFRIPEETIKTVRQSIFSVYPIDHQTSNSSYGLGTTCDFVVSFMREVNTLPFCICCFMSFPFHCRLMFCTGH